MISAFFGLTYRYPVQRSADSGGALIVPMSWHTMLVRGCFDISRYTE